MYEDNSPQTIKNKHFFLFMRRLNSFCVSVCTLCCVNHGIATYQKCGQVSCMMTLWEHYAMRQVYWVWTLHKYTTHEVIFQFVIDLIWSVIKSFHNRIQCSQLSYSWGDQYITIFSRHSNDAPNLACSFELEPTFALVNKVGRGYGHS